MEPGAQNENASSGRSSHRPQLPRVSACGITEIWPGKPGTEIIADIVLVHGLMGHPLHTWADGKISPVQLSGQLAGSEKKQRSFSRLFRGNKSRDSSPAPTEGTKTSGCYWPFDLLPEAFPSARIMMYGYDSYPTHFYKRATNRMTIAQHAEDLMNKLALNRANCEG